MAMHEHLCHDCGVTFNGDTPEDGIEHYDCNGYNTSYQGTWGWWG